jgi:hypothetical protein
MELIGYFQDHPDAGFRALGFKLPCVEVSLVGNDWDRKILPPPIFKEHLIAIIDTGSDICKIDSTLISELGAKVIGRNNVSYTGVRGIADVYNVSILIKPGYVFNGSMAAADLKSMGFDMLLGYDMLRSFDVEIRHSANVVLMTHI